MAKTRTVLGVQVSGPEARLLLAEAGETELTPVLSRTVTGSEALTKAIRALPRRPSAVVCAIPLSQAAIRTLSLPPTTDENLERLIALDAETALPIGTEELALGHHMLGMTEQSRLEVLLVAARQDAVQQALRSVNATAYISAQATLNSISLVNALQHLRGSQREPVCAVLNIEAYDSELLLLERSRVLTAQSINIGFEYNHEPVLTPEPVAVGVGAGGTQTMGGTAVETVSAYPWLQDLAHQVRYALQAISYERGLTVERLYVCGSGASLQNLDWELSEALDTPVALLTPPAGGGDTGPAYSVAFGCAVQAAGMSGISLNLTPARVTIAREVVQRRQNTLSWGALAGAAVVAAALVFGAAVHRQNQALATAQARLRELGVVVPAPAIAPAELKSASDAATTALQVRVPPAKLLSAVSQALPAGTWLSELNYGAETQTVLRGASTDPGGAQKAYIALLQQELFDDVTLDNVTEDAIGGTRVWAFQLTCKLRPKEQPGRRGIIRR